MDIMGKKLISWLFETNAIRVCPKNKPFWYTSGKIGPYYINTHFLYGSEAKANSLLNLIDNEKDNVLTCIDKVLEATIKNYNSDEIYKGLIDELCGFIKANVDLNEVDCISGGERRDWFFSPVIARMLNKPHLTIFKDLTVVTKNRGSNEIVNKLADSKILHIADLITEASSYKRAWIPAIAARHGQMKWSVVVIDRKQGGEELLAGEGIKSHAMATIDRELFEQVLSMGLIDNEQYEMIINYIDNPEESMKKFLLEHDEFLRNALASDEKTAERARVCIEKNIYGN